MWKYAIKALTWKNVRVRIRKPITLIIELLTSIAFFVLIFIFFEYTNSNKADRALPEQFNEPYPLLHKLNTFVCYEPDQPWTQDIMAKVAKTLKISKSKLPKPCSVGFSDIEDVPQVVFKSNSTELPDRLDYVMNVKGAGDLHLANSLDDLIIPHTYFADQYDKFSAIQGAINKAFIELKSGRNVTQNFLKEEFPFPSRKERDGSETAGNFDLYRSCAWLSLLPFSIFFTVRIITENLLGIAELMKMFGVSTEMLWVSHIINSLLLYLVFSIVNTVLMSIMVEHTDPTIFFVTFTFFFVYVVCLSLLLSSVIKTENFLALILVLLHCALMSVTQVILQYQTKKRPLHTLQSFLPMAPLVWVFQDMGSYEAIGTGSQWSNIARSRSDYQPSVLMCWVYFLLHSAVYVIWARYISEVFPGKYGMPKPWYHPFRTTKFLQPKVTPSKQLIYDDVDSQIPVNKAMFEPAPRDANVGVSIQNVSKVFEYVKALSHVTFDVFAGEITVLLGHNGAGKTTLMSIITGMYSPSEGDVYIDGVDTKSAGSQWRHKIGLCPQHNVSFPDVNVAEHVVFFGMLKGLSTVDAKENSLHILEQVKLSDKAGIMSEKLSGGMKRRLQLACAFAGNAEILVLDEPTSGLDVQTRRELWDILLSMRGSKSILLSTHFMEEADALADRVAALNSGILVAHATPMFLKRALGSGFLLTVNLKPDNDPQRIADVITELLPSATLKKVTDKSMQYMLPSKDTAKFPDAFKKLEGDSQNLKIASLVVGVTTLEEVFLTLCSDVEESRVTEESDQAIPDIHYRPVKVPRLWLNQAGVLLKRQAKYLWFSKYSFFIWNVIIPIVMMFLLTYYLTNRQTTEAAPNTISLDLKMYPGSRDNIVYFKTSDNYTETLKYIGSKYPEYEFIATEDIIGDILRTGSSLQLYKNLYVGLELNDYVAKALYTTVSRHALPASVDLLSNALATQYLGPSDENYFKTSTAVKIVKSDNVVQPKDPVNCVLWAGFFVILSCSLLATSLNLAVIERVEGVRHSHVMAGCSLLFHWLVRALWYLLLYFAIMQFWTMIAVLSVDMDRTFNNGQFIGLMFGVSTLAAASVLAFIFFVSLMGSSYNALSIFVIVLTVFYGFIIPMMGFFMGAKASTIMPVLWHLGYLFPMFHFYLSTLIVTLNARTVALCSLNRDRCVNGLMPGMQFDLTLEQMKQCCESGLSITQQSPADYFKLKNHLIYLFVCLIVYMVLLVLIDGGMFTRFLEKVLNSRYAPPEKVYHDAMVEEERKYVEDKINNTASTRNNDDICLVGDLHKCYKTILCKTNKAVRGVSFSVKKGECFGLLGVNGAGKTSIFRMLVSAQAKTRGKLQAGGYDQDGNRRAYLSKLSYCPQFGGVDEFLSCRSNVATMLTIKGLPSNLVKTETQKWLAVVGLHTAKGTIGTFSGGRKRRAATCIALSSAAREESVVLLDEPTSGVDPAAAKHMWSMIPKTQQSMILTSHSMQETEAMCNRIGIMARGELGALGTAGQLRASKATGYTAVLKLNTETQSGDVVDGSQVSSVKRDFVEMFPSQLQDEHEAMLQYHITDPEIKFSELFARMEALKSEHPDVIQDYSLSNCTLEEVFLSFAKDHDQHTNASTVPKSDAVSKV